MKVSIVIPLSREAVRKLNQMVGWSELSRGRFVEGLIKKEWKRVHQERQSRR